jgi:hypothetical protein
LTVDEETQVRTLIADLKRDNHIETKTTESEIETPSKKNVSVNIKILTRNTTETSTDIETGIEVATEKETKNINETRNKKIDMTNISIVVIIIHQT